MNQYNGYQWCHLCHQLLPRTSWSLSGNSNSAGTQSNGMTNYVSRSVQVTWDRPLPHVTSNEQRSKSFCSWIYFYIHRGSYPPFLIVTVLYPMSFWWINESFKKTIKQIAIDNMKNFFKISFWQLISGKSFLCFLCYLNENHFHV